MWHIFWFYPSLKQTTIKSIFELVYLIWNVTYLFNSGKKHPYVFYSNVYGTYIRIVLIIAIVQGGTCDTWKYLEKKSIFHKRRFDD